MSTVAFIGLGIMGEPMARNLLKGGHIVRALMFVLQRWKQYHRKVQYSRLHQPMRQ